MSHIPASKMPHPHASGDLNDGLSGGAQPAPEPTTVVPSGPAPLAPSADDAAQDMAAAGPSSDDEAPSASAAPGTATGNREGSTADRTAQVAGEPEAKPQDPVSGAVSAQDETARSAGSTRSAVGIGAVAIGVVAAVAGIVVAALPLLRDRPEPKSKKRARKRKA